MKRSATSRRMQALSGVGWSATLLGLLLMAVALLDASAALFSVALFLVFAGRTLAIATQGSSRTGKTFALGSRTMERGMFQTLFGSGWVIGAVGCYVLSLGIVFAVSLRFDAGDSRNHWNRDRFTHHRRDVRHCRLAVASIIKD